MKSRSKKYRENNKEKLNKSKKEYYKKVMLYNPDLIRSAGRRRRARRRMVNENYTIEDVKYTRDLFGHRCFRCGEVNGLTIDHHYPLIKGNPLTRQNAVLLCRSCNTSKSAKQPEEFYDEAMLDELEHMLGINK